MEHKTDRLVEETSPEDLEETPLPETLPLLPVRDVVVASFLKFFYICLFSTNFQLTLYCYQFDVKAI